MKIAVIHGQKHHGSTWNTSRILQTALLSAEDTYDEFFVNDVSACIGCFICIMRGEEKCPHRAVTEPIIKAIEDADVIVDAQYWQEQGWI